jgi:hypothetical protein
MEFINKEATTLSEINYFGHYSQYSQVKLEKSLITPPFLSLESTPRISREFE